MTFSSMISPCGSAMTSGDLLQLRPVKGLHQESEKGPPKAICKASPQEISPHFPVSPFRRSIPCRGQNSDDWRSARKTGSQHRHAKLELQHQQGGAVGPVIKTVATMKANTDIQSFKSRSEVISSQVCVINNQSSSQYSVRFVPLHSGESAILDPPESSS